MVDAGADVEDELAAEVSGGDEQDVTDPGDDDASALTGSGQTKQERDGIEKGGDEVEQSVTQADAALAVDGIAPIGIAGDGGAERSHDADRDQDLGGAPCHR